MAKTSSRLKAGAVPARGEVVADLQRASAGQFERLVAQGKGNNVLGVVDGDAKRIAAPEVPRGTKRLIHNHPRFTDVARGGGFSSDDLAFATDRYRGNFHVLSDEGSVYAMKAGRNAPRTSHGVDKLAARHTEISRAMVESLKANGASPYEARIVARSGAARVLKSEGVIAYREVLRGTEKAAVETHGAAMQKLIAQHMRQPQAGGMAQSIAKVSAVATPVAAAAVATLAYKRARAEGKDEARAALEAAGAGASTAIAPAAIGSGAAALAKSTSIGAKALGVATRALLPLSVVGHAGAYAYAAMQRGEGAGDIAKAAGWGAVNGIIPIDLVREAYSSVRGGSPGPSTSPAQRSVTGAALPKGEGASGYSQPDASAQEFARADAAFRQRWAGIGAGQQQAKAGAKSPSGETRKGWANPATQRAAQEARNVQNFSDWAEKPSG